ncbi:hypothetical protein DENSPDRAFT_713576 [Dentipellis sp. KUC8613]|nr:hypothetical protein DENSPDRAFT_713576 [Dentipellis sp. KUC8613]
MNDACPLLLAGFVMDGRWTLDAAQSCFDPGERKIVALCCPSKVGLGIGIGIGIGSGRRRATGARRSASNQRAPDACPDRALSHLCDRVL